MQGFRVIAAASLLGFVSAACAVPGPAVVVVPPAPSQTIYAEKMKANRVTAHTIYANEIKAQHVRGRVYRIERFATNGWPREIEAANVSASVIYVKQLEANSIDADTIYVHKMKVKNGRRDKDD